MATLEIKDLHVSVNTDETKKEILSGVNLTIKAGETHAIMGPNGSGKSTLSYAVAGHPKYEVTSGEVLLDGEDVLAMTVDERARAGLFLAMQYPVEVPGVSMSNFLRTAATAVRGEAPKLRLLGQGGQAGDGRPGHRPGVRRAQRERGLLRRREEAPRDPAARPAPAEDRDPRRDRLRPRRRRAARGVRGHQPGPGRRRGRHHADHPLHPDPAAHHAGLRARVRRWPDRRVRRLRARRRSSRSTATCGSRASRSRPASADESRVPG